jgi:hypothetical protein
MAGYQNHANQRQTHCSNTITEIPIINVKGVEGTTGYSNEYDASSSYLAPSAGASQTDLHRRVITAFARDAANLWHAR